MADGGQQSNNRYSSNTGRFRQEAPDWRQDCLKPNLQVLLEENVFGVEDGNQRPSETRRATGRTGLKCLQT